MDKEQGMKARSGGPGGKRQGTETSPCGSEVEADYCDKARKRFSLWQEAAKSLSVAATPRPQERAGRPSEAQVTDRRAGQREGK